MCLSQCNSAFTIRNMHFLYFLYFFLQINWSELLDYFNWNFKLFTRLLIIITESIISKKKNSLSLVIDKCKLNSFFLHFDSNN